MTPRDIVATVADPATASSEELRRAEMLLNVSRRVAIIESLDGILEALVEMTTRELGAERGTLFLDDPTTGELYSRFAQGNFHREIRILNTSGIAGHVFQTGEGLIIHDAYGDERFNRGVDKQTGYVTRNMICAPVKTLKDEIIGVAQVLNKKQGPFSEQDMKLLEAMTTQASIALQSTQFLERMNKNREQELEFLDMVADVTSELELGALLQRVMSEATRMLQADRSTLFLNDEKTGELWSQVGEGLGAIEIRFPNHLGIAGAVFTSGQTINIPYAYADLRFNPSFDKQTGYFTRSILCVPVVNKQGKTIGVTQVLNKRGGPFNSDDESRLRAFTAQVSIALENAKLFNDVQNMKNYNESILQSMSNAVITLDEERRIKTCNAAGLRMLGVSEADIVGKTAERFFAKANAWILERLAMVMDNQAPEHVMDAELTAAGGNLSVNVTVLPLISSGLNKPGSMIMLEDISSEKRMKSTMARHMDPRLVDKLLGSDEDLLGGQNSTSTVLFSDIRQFTTLTEEVGAPGTVALLNEYFTLMVGCIEREEGFVDKFIGDAIMAAFGVPIVHDDDEDRAVRAAVNMIRELRNWNRQRHAKGQRPVDMGIGLNTDAVVSGNIGSPKRMDYTIIGDGVNLASRLEGLCKEYKARILISETTYKALRGTYRSREVDRVIVKGKTKPVGIYEILDYHDDTSFPNIQEVLNLFKSGLGEYRRQHWGRAIRHFSDALRLNPGDQLSDIYVQRCQRLQAEPPLEDWDGVWIMKTK